MARRLRVGGRVAVLEIHSARERTHCRSALGRHEQLTAVGAPLSLRLGPPSALPTSTRQDSGFALVRVTQDLEIGVAERHRGDSRPPAAPGRRGRCLLGPRGSSLLGRAGPRLLGAGGPWVVSSVERSLRGPGRRHGSSAQGRRRFLCGPDDRLSAQLDSGEHAQVGEIALLGHSEALSPIHRADAAIRLDPQGVAEELQGLALGRLSRPEHERSTLRRREAGADAALVGA